MSKQALLLGVNIDHVATLRQARGTRYPDPVQAAMAAEEGGADAVTIHLREDRRHIQERDVFLIREVLLTRMNLEMAVTDEMMEIAERVTPAECCLVPERREELTTEGGLDVLSDSRRVTKAVERLTSAGIRVSLFIDPDPKQIRAAADTGAPVIEIHTGRYADAAAGALRQAELERIRDAIETGLANGLRVNAGHGLNYQNVVAVASLAGLSELNIGHAIIARALFAGLVPAVEAMRRLMTDARRASASTA